MKTIIVPISKANEQQIDDLLDMARNLFLGTTNVTEAYVIETDNPGMVAIAEALAAKSGQEPIAAPKSSNGNGKKTWSRKPKTPATEGAQ